MHHRHFDLTPLGELDGVAHQVHDHLAQAPGVAAHAIGHVRRHTQQQFQLLLVCAHRQGFHGVAQHGVEREIDHLDTHLARLDFGKIQNIVDDIQQRIGR